MEEEEVVVVVAMVLVEAVQNLVEVLLELSGQVIATRQHGRPSHGSFNFWSERYLSIMLAIIPRYQQQASLSSQI